MRNKNAVSKSYLSDRQRFAQLCNNQLFGGRKIIQPDKLRELDSGELTVKGERVPEMEALEKYRDVLRYENQRVEVEREHLEKKDLRGREYISGMAKSDRLMPVITLTVYWGKEAWDGAKSLHEMLDIPPVLSQYKDIINDYHMNLLEVHSMENLEDYSGELKAVLGFVRYQKDKETLRQFVSDNKDIFHNMTPETVRAISVLSNARELDNYLENRREDKEEFDMCEALQEMIMDGKEEGKVEGTAESVLNLLNELGDIPKELRAKIMSQKDLEILKKWLKLAARAETVEEFASRVA